MSMGNTKKAPFNFYLKKGLFCGIFEAETTNQEAVVVLNTLKARIMNLDIGQMIRTLKARAKEREVDQIARGLALIFLGFLACVGAIVWVFGLPIIIR